MDRDLGMNRPITRRDFVNGVAVSIGGALIPSSTLDAILQQAEYAPEQDPGYYPPALMGLRGSHPGSFEIAHAAFVEIARCAVMNGVRALPCVVRREREDADDAAHPIVRRAMAEERAVTAIVKNNEYASEKTSRQYCERQHQPVRYRQRVNHRHPQERVRHKGIDQLPARLPQ